MGLFSKKNGNNSKVGGALSGSLRDEKQKAGTIVNSIYDAVVLIDN